MREMMLFARNGKTDRLSEHDLKKKMDPIRENYDSYFSEINFGFVQPDEMDEAIVSLEVFTKGNYHNGFLYVNDPGQIVPEPLMPSYQPKVYDLDGRQFWDLREFLVMNQEQGRGNHSILQVAAIAMYKMS